MLILIEAANETDNFLLKFYPEFLKNEYKNGGKILSLNRYCDKQRELFWFSSPGFLIRMVHLCEIAVILNFVCNFAIFKHLSHQDETLCEAVIIAFTVLGFLAVSILSPTCIVKYSIVSNILLLRNFKAADEAIGIYKKRLLPSYNRVYR